MVHVKAVYAGYADGLHRIVLNLRYDLVPLLGCESYVGYIKYGADLVLAYDTFERGGRYGEIVALGRVVRPVEHSEGQLGHLAYLFFECKCFEQLVNAFFHGVVARYDRLDGTCLKRECANSRAGYKFR